jgi:hypothetical protein
MVAARRGDVADDQAVLTRRADRASNEADITPRRRDVRGRARAENKPPARPALIVCSACGLQVKYLSRFSASDYISFTSATEKVFDYEPTLLYNEFVTSVGLGTPDNLALLI